MSKASHTHRSCVRLMPGLGKLLHQRISNIGFRVHFAKLDISCLKELPD
jgi:hypothetical protein